MVRAEVVDALKHMTAEDQAVVLQEVFGNWSLNKLAALRLMDDYLHDDELNISQAMCIEEPLFPDEMETFPDQNEEIS